MFWKISNPLSVQQENTWLANLYSMTAIKKADV